MSEGAKMRNEKQEHTKRASREGNLAPGRTIPSVRHSYHHPIKPRPHAPTHLLHTISVICTGNKSLLRTTQPNTPQKNAARSTTRKQPSLAAQADRLLGRLKEPKASVHAHARARSKRRCLCSEKARRTRGRGQAARRQENWQRSRWFSASFALSSTPNVEDERSKTKPEIKMKRKQNEPRANTTQEKERRRQRKHTSVRATAVAVAVDLILYPHGSLVQSFVAPVLALRRGANGIWRLDADEGRRDERETGKATGLQDMGTGRGMTAGRGIKESKRKAVMQPTKATEARAPTLRCIFLSLSSPSQRRTVFVPRSPSPDSANKDGGRL
ncbi:hypothetical protein C8R45DRAFT_938468 [Mycena sanguinolenta]|nr:hypothetical protein C8R45DRAFT_938468 [Mycena sanguinolenta]